MLHISDPSQSFRFYIDFMGMSLIFTLNTGPFVVYYLAYPGQNDRSPADIAKSMSSRAGLLELVHVPRSERNEGFSGLGDHTFLNRGFGHLGFCVPSVEETLKRARSEGWTVLKATNDVSLNAMDLSESRTSTPLHPDFLVSFRQVGFISDPDGAFKAGESPMKFGYPGLGLLHIKAKADPGVDTSFHSLSTVL
ncbi:uncharacterized protein A1O9_12710 [Exophiala aquamarina CBS 119918]|uniref:Glyoxalase/fosfomycin resistance/dioxygenase domain-containing protein n=1 Tax=Exophiala aquamarina CBS 119918 TaxID=1182545 RepID=A0A072NV02_9EURO|nr:uncharacterized protein A1O9_12710 [Exophiala aquamarina CBS 119918]KEF51207.1 hypothetical protein A1O9_12710 [Exophiala aquamarina CBS 119918]